MDLVVVIKVIFAFAFGLLAGLNYRAKKEADEAMDNFLVQQRLRDENATLKKQVEQLQKNLYEHGII